MPLKGGPYSPEPRYKEESALCKAPGQVGTVVQAADALLQEADQEVTPGRLGCLAQDQVCTGQSAHNQIPYSGMGYASVKVSALAIDSPRGQLQRCQASSLPHCFSPSGCLFLFIPFAFMP